MTAQGQEDPFSQPRLNSRYRLGEPTFARMGGKEEDAPKADYPPQQAKQQLTTAFYTLCSHASG
jgi:hypothetical protein